MKKVLLATALAVMGGNAWAETSEFTCPSGSASTLHCFTCGSNCTMTLDTSTGHAVVEGTGDMEGKAGGTSGNNPWNVYNSAFKSVEIKNGITSVGVGAFQGANIESAIIPNTVTTIGVAAFSNAHKLTNLTIPNSVSRIEDWAFAQTDVLKSLIIPDSVIEMGKATFNHSGIKTLTISDSFEWKSLCVGAVVCGDHSWTFNGVSLQNVICAGGGDIAKCDALLAQTGKNIQSTSRPNYKLDKNGNIVERYQYDENGNKYTTATYEYNEDGKLVATYSYDKNGKKYLLTADGKLSLKNADGSTSIYNKDGSLVGIKGKKIYTVEEAEAVTAHGDKFHVSLTYK